MITKRERVHNIIIVFCFSATGQYIPPKSIFNRMGMEDGLEKMHSCTQARYINVENLDGLRKSYLPNDCSSLQNLLMVLQLILGKFANAVIKRPILPILDNDFTHFSLAFNNFYKIHLLTFPHHTSHRTQPLDVTYFKC